MFSCSIHSPIGHLISVGPYLEHFYYHAIHVYSKHTSPQAVGRRVLRADMKTIGVATQGAAVYRLAFGLLIVIPL